MDIRKIVSAVLIFSLEWSSMAIPLAKAQQDPVEQIQKLREDLQAEYPKSARKSYDTMIQGYLGCEANQYAAALNSISLEITNESVLLSDLKSDLLSTKTTMEIVGASIERRAIESSRLRSLAAQAWARNELLRISTENLQKRWENRCEEDRVRKLLAKFNPRAILASSLEGVGKLPTPNSNLPDYSISFSVPVSGGGSGVVQGWTEGDSGVTAIATTVGSAIGASTMTAALGSQLLAGLAGGFIGLAVAVVAVVLQMIFSQPDWDKYQKIMQSIHRDIYDVGVNLADDGMEIIHAQCEQQLGDLIEKEDDGEKPLFSTRSEYISHFLALSQTLESQARALSEEAEGWQKNLAESAKVNFSLLIENYYPAVLSQYVNFLHERHDQLVKMDLQSMDFYGEHLDPLLAQKKNPLRDQAIWDQMILGDAVLSTTNEFFVESNTPTIWDSARQMVVEGLRQ